MASGMSNALRVAVINASSPTGATAGAAGTQSLGLSTAAAMKVRLNSTSSTAAAAGTELTGTGYTAGGQAFAESQTAISGSTNSISLPKTTALSWTNGSGGSWSIVSLDITDGAGTPVRAWWGDFTGQPVSVANGNTFQIAASGITITLTLFSTFLVNWYVCRTGHIPMSKSARWPSNMKPGQACQPWPASTAAHTGPSGSRCYVTA